MRLRPVAYVMCELKSRDLDSGLLIAKTLVNKRYPVVIGQRWAIGGNLTNFDAPKGAVLFRTCNQIQAEGMKSCRAAGHAVFAMDEEALALADDTILDSTDGRTFEYCEKFLANSDLHRRIVKSRFPNAKIHVTGNPRMEVLRANKGKPEPGDYVLFNTSFVLTNSVWGSVEKALEVTANAALGFGEAQIKLWREFEESSRQEMLELIRWCADRYPTVVRPHPAENADWWDEFPKIKIVKRSDPVPWMLGARLMVHGSSTTGLEAAALGVPVLNICPTAAEPFAARYVMGHTNYTVRTAGEACSAIAELLDHGSGPIASWKPSLDFPVHGATRIGEAIAKVLPEPDPRLQLPWMQYQRTKTQIDKITVPQDEMASKVPWARVQQLDDSVFLLTPHR